MAVKWYTVRRDALLDEAGKQALQDGFPSDPVAICTLKDYDASETARKEAEDAMLELQTELVNSVPLGDYDALRETAREAMDAKDTHIFANGPHIRNCHAVSDWQVEDNPCTCVWGRLSALIGVEP